MKKLLFTAFIIVLFSTILNAQNNSKFEVGIKGGIIRSDFILDKNFTEYSSSFLEFEDTNYSLYFFAKLKKGFAINTELGINSHRYRYGFNNGQIFPTIIDLSQAQLYLNVGPDYAIPLGTEKLSLHVNTGISLQKIWGNINVVVPQTGIYNFENEYQVGYYAGADLKAYYKKIAIGFGARYLRTMEGFTAAGRPENKIKGVGLNLSLGYGF